jgi:hypothetical protein
MPFANPRNRHHHRRHHRNRSHGAARHNWPIIMNRHRRHHRNPEGGGVTMFMRKPGDLLMGGAVGAVAAFGSIAFPNSFLPFPGTTMMDKVLRLASRAAAGGLLVTLMRKMAPRYANDALIGATIAVGGGFVLDLLGITLAIGKGDTVLLPGQLVPTNLSSMFTSITGQPLAGYTRPMGALAMPAGGTFGAYSSPQVPFRGIYGPGSMGIAGESAARIYGG